MHLISKGVVETYSEYTHRGLECVHKHADKHAETNKTDRSRGTQGERGQSTQQYSQAPQLHTHTPVNVATRPLE